MNKKYIWWIVVLVLIIIVVAAASWFFFFNKQDCEKNKCFTDETPVPSVSASQEESQLGGNAQIANPASVNCIDKGGQLEIRTDEAGGQYGVCKFDNGSECEEWKFFREECLPR
jgi:putative hemolysin